MTNTIKLSYITHYAYIPSFNADAICIMNTCSALSAYHFEIELIIPSHQGLSFEKLGQSKNIWEFYDLAPNFSIRKLPSKILYALGFLGRVIYKSISLIYSLLRKPNVFYTRQLEIAYMLAVFNLPTILSDHDPSFLSDHPLFSRWVKLFKSPKKPIGMVTVTHSGAKRLKDWGIPEDKILVAPNGVDINRFFLGDSSRALKEKLNMPLNQTIVCFSGNLFPGRGVEDLLDSATHHPLIKFYILGGNPEDITRCENYSKKLNLNNVHFTGFIPPKLLPQYLLATDILVMPYTTKTKTHLDMSPMKMFDYMAAGKPIISTDFPVIREILSNKVNALLVPPQDGKKIAEGIQWIIDHPTKSKEMGARARNDVLEYTWDKRAKHLNMWIRDNFGEIHS